MKILSQYGHYQPKGDYSSSIGRVVRSLPTRYFNGLGAIVLRDETSLTREERRRGFGNCEGIYVRAKRSSSPRIELFVDNIFKPWPRWIHYVPLVRYEIVHAVLFHELGHHLQDTLYPDRSRSEGGATDLGRKLSRHSFAVRYPLLVPMIRVLR